jgi:hypothetical protein
MKKLVFGLGVGIVVFVVRKTRSNSVSENPIEKSAKPKRKKRDDKTVVKKRDDKTENPDEFIPTHKFKKCMYCGVRHRRDDKRVACAKKNWIKNGDDWGVDTQKFDDRIRMKNEQFQPSKPATRYGGIRIKKPVGHSRTIRFVKKTLLRGKSQRPRHTAKINTDQRPQSKISFAQRVRNCMA